MEVEDVLPRRWPVRLRQVEAVWSELLIQKVGDSLGHDHYSGNFLFRDGPDVGGVCPRYDKGVAFHGLSAIEERHGAVILSHDVGGRLASDDPAEDAIGHGGSLAATSLAVPAFGGTPGYER
jgi:hypothetical protein